MIRKSIEKGTTVWNATLGFGTFENWGNSGWVFVSYPDGCVRAVLSKLLTEVEGDIK
jgi:hypothetical protein